MQSILVVLKSHVDILQSSVLPQTGRRGKVTKTDRQKAIVAIHDLLDKKSTRAALTTASTFEMVRGPPAGESSSSVHLGWIGLVNVLCDTLHDACDEALSSRTTAKSGQASIKPIFMKCFKHAVRYAMQDAPSGVIRPIVPSFLIFAHEYLAEPAIRRVLADDIWQCVRDILHDAANRAMLLPAFIRTWVDDCFQQLTGRGPMNHSSVVATSLAGELLQILASSVSSYDVLSQSSRAISPSKMLGGDFGYALICERSCLMLVVAESLPRGQARNLQLISMQTLSIALTDHAVDVWDSSAVSSIINIAYAHILSCWVERKCHFAAVSLSRILLSIAPNNKKLAEGIRSRIRADVTDVNTSALVRAGKDVTDDYIDAAASCFSLREALEFATATNVLPGHVIIWLRVASSIMTARTLKRDTSVLIDPRDVFDQCARATEVVSQIMMTQSRSGGISFSEIVYWSCEVAKTAASIADRIFLTTRNSKLLDNVSWVNLVQTIRELLNSFTFSSKSVGHSRNVDSMDCEESLVRAFIFLSSIHLLNHASLDSPGRAGFGQAPELPYPLSRILSSERQTTPRDVELFRNLVARNGFSDEDGTGLRYRLVHALLSVCEGDELSDSLSPDLLINASATLVGIIRGECGLSRNIGDPSVSSLSDSEAVLLREQFFFGLSVGLRTVGNNGVSLVKRMRDQDAVWSSHVTSICSQNKLYDGAPGMLASRSTTECLIPMLSRHFAIPSNLSHKLENEMLSRMKETFESLKQSTNAERNPQAHNLDDQNEFLFMDVIAMRKGLKLLVMVCNYLLEGLHHGLILTTDTGKNEEDHPDELISLINSLFPSLIKIDMFIVLDAPDLSKTCMILCCNLVKVLQDNRLREKWNPGSLWGAIYQTISNTMSKLASNLCEHFVNMIIDSTKTNRKIIQAFADDRLENTLTEQIKSGRKRGYHETQQRPAKRRRRKLLPLGEGASSDEAGFPSESENDPMNDDNQNLISDSESDDFGDESLRTKADQQTMPKSSAKSVDRNGELMNLFDLLTVLVTSLPSAKETILECIINGLNALTDVERMLSPDGFERAALFSSLVDEGCLQARKLIWNILFSADSVSALIHSGRDILKFGRYWKTLENLSQSYVMFHVDPNSGKRKQYPLPQYLEDSRLDFLDYARMFIERMQCHQLSRSTEFTSSTDEVRRIVGGFLDISELFRTQHAFRMPRRARLAYLKFGASLVLFRNKGLLTDSLPQSFDDASVGMSEKIKNIQAAICKLLGDSEALVRFVAARTVINVFSSWEVFPIAEVERILEENLPPSEICIDNGIVAGTQDSLTADTELTEVANQWNLSEKEMISKFVLQQSFQKLGAMSKGYSTILALGEVCAAREDLIPYFYRQMSQRSQEKSRSTVTIYYVAVRICLTLGLRSPRYLYRVFSRVVLPYLLNYSRSPESIYLFPCEIALDENQHRDGVLVDWLENEQSNILPHLLVQEKTNSLEFTLHFAEKIGVRLDELLERNVCAFAVVFPMQFTPGLHEKGQKLWSAIDAALGGKTFSLMSNKKDEVIASLLLSTSSNFVCRNAMKDRSFDVERVRGFSRDTRSMRPPFYDPLVVASAINHLHGTSSNTSVVSKSALKGPLFNQLRDETNGLPVVNKFPAFLKECCRPNSSLMRCLLTVSKALDPTLTSHSLFNRLDAYFCVGLLWMMLDIHILLKPANERKIFYRLLSVGFYHIETCSDAEWLLLDVQKKLLSVKTLQNDFQVYDTDLGLREEDRGHLSEIVTTEERLMYELMSIVCPVLVSVIVDHSADVNNHLLSTGQSALTKLLTLCHREKFWTAILCHGAFPGGKCFKEARSVYAKALENVEGTDRKLLPPIFSSLKRFGGIYRQRSTSHPIISGLSCLHELRTLLTDANVLKLSQHIEGEAWLRSNGEMLPTAGLIRSSIAALVNVLGDVSGQGANWFSSGQIGQASKVRHDFNIEEQVVHVAADVLNTLGLLQQNSWTFVQTDVNNFSIPAKQVTGNYENIQDGIFQSMFCLVDVLRSGSSIASEAALNSLIAILQSADGKLLYNAKRDELRTIASLRVSDRKGTAGGIDFVSTAGRDLSGEIVIFDTLPRFDDHRLWDLSAYNSQEGSDYEGWMRRLCAVLCLKCQSPANQALAGACFTSFHLCRTRLPYILMDIVCDLDADTKSNFSALIVRYVMTATQTPLDILRIFVRALDVLCQVGQSIICQNGISGWPVITRTGKVSIPHLYLLDIPYSVATLAALKCGATFSAIRYSHLYVDHKVMESEANIRGQNSKAPLERRHSSYIGKDPLVNEVEQAALNKAKPWLRHAMMQISDMDGIRAFAPSDTLAESAVSLSNSDEEWFRSLAALGVASRAAHASFLGPISKGSTTKTSSTFGVDLRREYASFRSLFGIGNLNIAAHYWDGLLNRIAKDGFIEASGPFQSNRSLVNKMNDLRYAAAWKLELWESPNLISTKVGNELSENNNRFSFHHAIYRSLHLIKTDRHSEISKVLSSARKQILDALIQNNCGVSAQMIIEASCQLRVFQVLESTLPGWLNPALQSLGSVGLLSHGSQRELQFMSCPLSKDLSENSSYSNHNGNGLTNLELVLGDQYGMEDSSSLSVLPSRDAFSEIALVEDLPAVLIRCIGEHSQIARAAATTSARILFNGGSGSWARSACCLGTMISSLVAKASRTDETAWKLQECRLKWTACDDARLRKQALGEVKDTIFNSLGGKMHERTSDSSGSSESHSLQQSLSWEMCESDSQSFGFLRSEACRLAATWSLDMKSHEPMDLFQTYLEPGLNAAQSTGSRMLIGRAHYAMASFADAQIGNINSYRRSRKFEQLVMTVTETEEHIERLKQLKKERIAKAKLSSRRRRMSSEASGIDKMGKDLDYVISTNIKQARQDRSRIEKLNDTFKKWQVLACEHFAACLRDGTTHDVRVAFRMVALWLDAGDMRDIITCALTGEKNLSSVAKPLQVPVRKLLPLAPQLFSRLNFSEHAAFQKTLSSTITDMAGKYPSYCLWQLLSLTNATRTSGNEERMSSLYRGDKDKRDAAVDIFRRLEAKHGRTVQEMREVSDAYIVLSESPIQKGADGSTIDISRTPLLRLGELRHVSVPTVALPMQGLEDYHDNLPHIQGFDRGARVCAGLSKPLKIKCLGSDGIIYPQIVKGRDDLRGDAVMEQMFTILNSLLENDREASRRNLYIRTYRIIPLSPFTGIMQFVKNTMQFKELLVDKDQERSRRTNLSVKGSLHDRYRPDDIKHVTVASRAFKDHENFKNNVSKRLVFMKVVWKKLQPVFRYFFVEQWPDPAEWFTHQLNYSRSMAVMSIVGFILGLGDRHLSNILVDVHTGEIVHIDFGVAFEQGKLLPTPEHMPFRLTRDLVDGFGVSGVEGVFRRGCEITLAVMRRYKDVLLTVVEVLLHDPMFNWALTPEEILREQLDPDGRIRDNLEEKGSTSSPDSSIEGVALKIKRDVGGSREAHRALNRISEKLDGLEGTERLSVEAHVARLVDEAQAFHVIAPVFPGWNPWL